MRERRNIELQTEDDRTILTHPAFGIISLSRTSGGNPWLFGSTIENENKICLRISRGIEERTLSNDFRYPKQRIIEVEMSYSQFAECISSMNRGEGIPCTITYTENNGLVPAIAENVSKRKQFQDEFKEVLEKAMEQTTKEIDFLNNALKNKKKLTVKEVSDIVSSLYRIKNNIGANLEFMPTQFDEHMEKVEQDARITIDAFLQQQLAKLSQNRPLAEETVMTINESSMRKE